MTQIFTFKIAEDYAFRYGTIDKNETAFSKTYTEFLSF